MKKLLRLCDRFTAHVRGNVNVVNLRMGDCVQFYPFSLRGKNVVIRKLEKNKPIGRFVSICLKDLYLSEEQEREIKEARELLKNHERDFLARINEFRCVEFLNLSQTDDVRVWFNAIESSVRVKEKSGMRFFSFNRPVLVAVEKQMLNPEVADIYTVDVSDLVLSSKQRSKIKEILSLGVQSLMKELKFSKKEIEAVEEKLPKILEKVFISEEIALGLAEVIEVGYEF